MMMMISVVVVVVLIVVVVPTITNVQVVSGFAYAPNFITKIIEEQTSIQPIGLLKLNEYDPIASTSFIKNDNNPGSQNHDEVSSSSTSSPTAVLTKSATKTFVKTRFPPEPNGYLHLGHAKAISFNFAVARAFQGVCHMRMDDTNPSKEEKEYVDSILEDVVWILSNDDPSANDGEWKFPPWDGPVRKTSDYFDLIYQCAVKLIQSGDAYVDSLTAEQMREYRGTLTEPGIDSPYRTRTIEENLRLFDEMKQGVHPDGAHVLRAKISMSSPNINLRDPTLYRIKHESHQETGDTWCIYPLYDFSHPISDSFENITHSLCTLEFEDHRPFYDWTLQKLIPTNLLQMQSQQIEFSRLNIKSTVLSKRKLIQLVTERYVNGWDDPRMPTLSGFRRRGVPPSAIRLFCERVGISKADSNIDYSVLEDCIRETMDRLCPRAFCVLNPLKISITNSLPNEENVIGDITEVFHIDKHPKTPSMGQRAVPFSSTVYIERDDFFDTIGPEGIPTGGRIPKGFKRLVPGGKVRLRYAYVVECQEIVRDPDTNEPIELKCIYYPETRAGVTPSSMERVPGIIHWVDAKTSIPCTINQYDRLFVTEEPGKNQPDNDFLKDINPDSFQTKSNAFVEESVGMDTIHILEQIQKLHQQQLFDQRESEEFVDGANKHDNLKMKLYPSSLSYQFERNGYFALDTSATKERLVFNRVVTLRDTWGATATTKSNESVLSAAPNARNRGKNSESGNSNAAPSSDSTSVTTGPIEDIQRIAFRAATIISAEQHPEAETLLVCLVDCGDGNDVPPRTVVAGLAGKIPINELIEKKVVAVTNLKPSKMRGIESTAMLLAATSKPLKDDDVDVVELLQVPDTVPNGELIQFDGFSSPQQPDAMMKSKGALKAFERALSGLKTNHVGQAVYCKEDITNDQQQQQYAMMSSAGPITTASLLPSAIIK